MAQVFSPIKLIASLFDKMIAIASQCPSLSVRGFPLVQVNWEKYKKALWRCAFNCVVVTMIFNLVTYPLAVWRGLDAGYELPSFATTIWHLFGYIVLEEIGFYYSHRYVCVCVHVSVVLLTAIDQ